VSDCERSCVCLGASAGAGRLRLRTVLGTELSVYPREPHGVTERRHMLDMTEKTLGWLERWLPMAGRRADSKL
jgi:hypothetical protein